MRGLFIVLIPDVELERAKGGAGFISFADLPGKIALLGLSWLRSRPYSQLEYPKSAFVETVCG